MLAAAFDSGQQNSAELRDQEVEDIILNFQKGKDADWVTMSVSKLIELPAGSQIYHSLFGHGIVTHKGSEKYVQFQGFRIELVEEGFPWTSKLQLIT